MLKEYTRPISVPIYSDNNVFSILAQRVHRVAHETLIEYKNAEGTWASYTAEEFQDIVRGLAKGLIKLGVEQGTAVGILSHTRWEWTALDLAIMSIGAVTVPVYETNSPAQIKNIVLDSHIEYFFVEDADQKAKITEIREDIPQLLTVFVMDDENAPVPFVKDIMQTGADIADEVLESRMRQVSGDTLATIVYTSGSTGTPKGIELSHRNFVFAAYSGIQSMPDICWREGGARLLLFLPLAHVFARYMQFYCIGSDTVLGLSGNMKTIIDDFQTFMPTFILAVPRIFEKVYNAAVQKAGQGFAGQLFERAASMARQWSHMQQSGEKLSWMQQRIYNIYDHLIYKNILDVFGGQVDFAVSGGAPLDASIAHFFNGVGLPLLEGYGMTETCAPACVNPTQGYKIGTVGLPLEGITFGIADDGELCIKSESICRGYHNHPEITETQIADGWLHTGDLGDIDEDGFITITGRKKDVIITAGGKNVSPVGLESSVMISPVVDQCVVIGDKKPFIAALVTLDMNDTNAWLKAQNAAEVSTLAEAAENPLVIAEVEQAVSHANEQVSRAESIRKFKILTESFTQDNGMLTASLKAKRNVIVDRFADIIDNDIYGAKSK
ncbi:AMP-dependent synthetase/ligase [Alloscardovia criceti]|uniref:AMP-dependent synthetase/ligase n=1 Tax=Alloscardovia criceti TaxID=356828 RepID=UPI00036D59D4|nr:AMP-dependent synthetase/ligase [Alloscardovia criceti]